jgi:hypothetical protein
MPVFGPGTLQIGEVGSEIEASCLVNSLRIAMSKDEGDSTTKLCGTVRPGKITYTYALSGNVDVDSESADGLFALSQSAPGSQQPFTFTPNTEAGTTATGTLVIDPLDFGADEYGDDMTSDFEFALVGKPTYTYPDETPEALAARGFSQLVVNGRDAKPEPVAQPAAAAATQDAPADDELVDA